MSLWKISAKTEVIRDVCEMQFTTCLHHSSVITGKTEPDLKTHIVNNVEESIFSPCSFVCASTAAAAALRRFSAVLRPYHSTFNRGANPIRWDNRVALCEWRRIRRVLLCFPLVCVSPAGPNLIPFPHLKP